MFLAWIMHEKADLLNRVRNVGACESQVLEGPYKATVESGIINLGPEVAVSLA